MTTIAEVVRQAREKAQPAAATPATTTTETPKAAVEQKFKAVCVDDHGVIIGIGASIAVDSDDETVEKGALLGIAYDFCAQKGREFRVNHDESLPLEAELVCSWPGAPILKSGKILTADMEMPVDDPIVGINIEKGNETHWFVGIRPADDKITEAARKGEIVGFSWGGMALKEGE